MLLVADRVPGWRCSTEQGLGARSATSSGAALVQVPGVSGRPELGITST